MNHSNLLFDEFDVKEHSTIEYLKKGKKAFGLGYIHNVSLQKIVCQAPTYVEK